VANRATNHFTSHFGVEDLGTGLFNEFVTDSLAHKSPEELFQVGEFVCRGREWRWVAIWVYNIHMLFRGAMQPRKVWDDLDGLIRVECEWHLGSDLFRSIRQITLSVEKDPCDTAEYSYLKLGEIAAKCISNASWRPGLFDFDAPWMVPALAFEMCRHLHDEKSAEFLHHHFTSLSRHRHADKPARAD
jgi:hypothetical protein